MTSRGIEAKRNTRRLLLIYKSVSGELNYKDPMANINKLKATKLI